MADLRRVDRQQAKGETKVCLKHRLHAHVICRRITVTFQKANGEVLEKVTGNEGDDIVDLAQEYDLDIEAACEKSLACSTCHVILSEEIFDKLEEPSDEEADMLDLVRSLSCGCSLC